MISLNSNCSRIDAIKATANQLKMQATQVPHSTPETSGYKKMQTQIQDLDQQIKSGDPQKAETALASAVSTVRQLQTQKPSSQRQTGLDVYA